MNEVLPFPRTMALRAKWAFELTKTMAKLARVGCDCPMLTLKTNCVQRSVIDADRAFESASGTLDLRCS